jgi:hypothetical protein
LARIHKPRFQQTDKRVRRGTAMHESKILHRLAVLHGAIRAYQPLESMDPDRRAQLLQSARELTGTKYRSLRAALSGIEKKIITLRAGRRTR